MKNKTNTTLSEQFQNLKDTEATCIPLQRIYMTEYFPDVFPCTDISLKSGGAKLKSNSALLKIVKE